MPSVLDFLKSTSRLSSLPFMLVMFGAGVVLLLRRRTARAGRIWLVCVWLVFWIASTPAGSMVVAWPVATAAAPIQSRADARGANAVVMLGNGIFSHVASGVGIDDLGASALRVVETVRVYHLLDNPIVIVSGGDTQHLTPARTEASAYRDAVIRLGVPADRVVMEDRSQTTRDEALLLGPILSGLHITRFVLVTSPTHIPRSVRALRKVGLDPIPSPSPSRSTPAPLWSVMPDRESLSLSDAAVYDAAAMIYYRLRGWI